MHMSVTVFMTCFLNTGNAQGNKTWYGGVTLTCPKLERSNGVRIKCVRILCNVRLT